MENNSMDKMVRDAIGDYESNVPSSNWDEMETLIEKDSSMRRRLYIAKGIEVLLMVFAIWTVIQFVNTDTNTSNTNAVAPTNQPSEQQHAPIIIDNNDNNSEQEATPSKEAVPSNGKSEKSQATKKALIFANVGIKNPQRKQTEDGVFYVENQFDNNVKNNSPIAITVHDNINKNNQLTKNSATNKNAIPNNLLSRPIASIASLNSRLLQNYANSLSPIPSFFKETEEEDEKGMKKKKKWSLGAFASLDWFSIKPDKQVNPNVIKQAQSINPGFGLIADYALNKNLELDFGVAFAKKSHTIRTTTQQSNGIEARVEGINSYAVEVPVGLKYNFVNKGNTKFYALTGVSNYFITDVDIRGIDYEVYNSMMAAPPSPNRQPVADLGLMEQGELSSNHYMSLNGGFGAEHSFTSKKEKQITIFAQANYKHGLFKTGRHDDQISTLTVAIGAKGHF